MYIKTLMFFVAFTPSVVYAYSYKDMKCLADNAFYEARGEGVKGMQAVMDVTLNRVKSDKFPSTVCGVVYQRKQFSWTHQPKQKITKKELDYEYEIALHLARNMMLGSGRGITKGALFYHERNISPTWSKQMYAVKRIKKHVFYVANN